jgi:hypothetical protein
MPRICRPINPMEGRDYLTPDDRVRPLPAGDECRPWGNEMPLIMERRVRPRFRQCGGSGYDLIGRPMSCYPNRQRRVEALADARGAHWLVSTHCGP